MLSMGNALSQAFYAIDRLSMCVQFKSACHWEAPWFLALAGRMRTRENIGSNPSNPLSIAIAIIVSDTISESPADYS